MGAIASRQNDRVEEAEVTPNHAYRYPPRSGNYFGSHFIMGGEKFDTPQPEAYLFGENTDLNFLGSRPTHFPYPPPQSNEPTKTLKSLVNIRKESLRFVRCPNNTDMKESDIPDGDTCNKGSNYNIEFTFDCDAKCAITIYYFCTEEVTANKIIYHPRDPSTTSPTYRYKRGANQQFCQIAHMFDPTKYQDDELLYNMEKEVIPIAINMEVDEGSSEMSHSHTTIAIVERHSDGTYVLKALKQKIFVDGLSYLLQEIYGIENKNLDTKVVSDDETEDNGSECVICMCDQRDTLILPCRHLCLCNSCADSLRYQANNCPICRAPFRALLQIRALKKISGATPILPINTNDGSMENIPPGYEPVSLIEALNGPSLTRATLSEPILNTPPSPDNKQAVLAAEKLNRCNLERNSSSCSGGSIKKQKSGSPRELETKPPRDRALGHPSATELRMSVLLAREEEGKTPNEKTTAHSPLLFNQRTKPTILERAKNKNNSIENEYTLEDLEMDAADIGDGEFKEELDANKISQLLNGQTNGLILPNGPTAESPRSPSPKCTTSSTGSEKICNAPTLQPIDDTDTDEPDRLSTASLGTTCPNEMGSPLREDDCSIIEEKCSTLTMSKNRHHDLLNNTYHNSSTESTPQRWALPNHITSLPGTPLSHISNRSSGESYSSSSSTRQLITTSTIPTPLSTTDTHC